MTHLSVVGHVINTVGFHNFNLRIFNLRVSNPNNYFFHFYDTISDFSVPGSRPPKNTTKFRTSTVSLEAFAGRSKVELVGSLHCVGVVS